MQGFESPDDGSRRMLINLKEVDQARDGKEAGSQRENNKTSTLKIQKMTSKITDPFTETQNRAKLVQKSRPNPVRGHNQIKDFFSELKAKVVDHGPKVVESNLNSATTLQEKDWRMIIIRESRDNVSHSILYNSLRRGIPHELRPQIWAFLIDVEKMQAQYVCRF